MNVTLRANFIHVKGELLSGTETEPITNFTHKIVLTKLTTSSFYYIEPVLSYKV
jgi:hypothetical protein